nr:MAG TPA: hypothetical protein [Caudoviricetes sp.]
MLLYSYFWLFAGIFSYQNYTQDYTQHYIQPSFSKRNVLNYPLPYPAIYRLNLTIPESPFNKRLNAR